MFFFLSFFLFFIVFFDSYFRKVFFSHKLFGLVANVRAITCCDDLPNVRHFIRKGQTTQLSRHLFGGSHQVWGQPFVSLADRSNVEMEGNRKNDHCTDYTLLFFFSKKDNLSLSSAQNRSIHFLFSEKEHLRNTYSRTNNCCTVFGNRWSIFRRNSRHDQCLSLKIVHCLCGGHQIPPEIRVHGEAAMVVHSSQRCCGPFVPLAFEHPLPSPPISLCKL